MDSLIPFLAETDEEIAIYYEILCTKNRNYHKLMKRPGVFCLDELDESFCFTHFRFYKADIQKLKALFEIPEEIILDNRIKVFGEEALCILLRRLAYPNRYADLMQFFPRGRTAIGLIFNAMVRHILHVKGHVLENMNQAWLSRNHVKLFCESVYRKGSPYRRCFGFLDATLRSNCRPIRNQRQFYNGHKRVHAVKYQSLILPNGIIANLFGPVNGRRHDSYVLAKSGLLDQLEQKFNVFRSPPYLYSDTGFPLKRFLMVPFKGRVNRRQKILNKRMSKLRITVEWGFSKIIQLFPFLDFKKNMKVYKQEVGNYYKIGALLTNCHTCLYGSQVSEYFECSPPKLQDYLDN